ncbi:MAG: hypothetical protein LBC02_05300, partial [Planctomycetaceae bacterium]|nr:hypothetical protein [Planctomycetaceae bacterium]
MHYLNFRFRVLPLFIFVFIFYNVYLTVSVAHAQTSAAQTKQQSDPFVVPTNKTPKELLEYAQKTLQENRIPTDLPRTEFLEQMVRQAKFIIEIADTALSLKPEKSLQNQIFLFKFQGLFGWAKAENDPAAVQKLESYLDELDALMP